MNPLSPPPPGGPGAQLPVEVLQAALATEHAAIWAYGLAGAFVNDDVAGSLAEAASAHRARRDATERVLLDLGAQPVPPEPAYLPPEPVTDTSSALRLVLTTEDDAAVTWRTVIEHGSADPDSRRAALDALTAAAVRATRWRVQLDLNPVTVPFPGTP